jgi:signal peptidase I
MANLDEGSDSDASIQLGKMEMWIDKRSKVPEFNVLVTVSDLEGEHSYLVTGNKVVKTKSSLFVQAPEERIVVGTRSWYRKATVLTRWFGYVLAFTLISFSILSFQGSIKARVVLTGSMAPTINPGDMILTTSPSNITPKIGSVVAYVGRRFDGTAVGVFSHRIIGGSAETGFIVKGDANPAPDTQKPKIPDITGVVIFVVPLIGKFLTPKSLMVIIPLIFGLWLILDALKNE